MLCLALIMGFTTFTFAGCSDGGNNTGSGGSVSSSGGGTTNSGGGTSGGGSTSGGESTTPIVTEPQLKTMGTYFSGIRAEYEKTNFLNQNNQTKTFEQLLDQQFDVLAQDLIYRLTYVYGYDTDMHIRNSNESFGFDYSLESHGAEVVHANIVSASNNHLDIHSLSQMDVNCLSCYQSSLDNLVVGSSRFLHVKSLFLPGAIEGRYLKVGGLDNDQLSSDKNESLSWNLSVDVSTYNNYLEAYKNIFKLALAQLVAGDEISAVYNEVDYHNTLSKINCLGYDKSYKSKVVDFINDKVIGSSLINKDNTIYKNNFASSSLISSAFNVTETGEYCPRFYKGYNIVIPAIVEQALANTFDGTTTSLYPKLNRYAIETSNNVGGLSGAKEYRSIVLMPKTNTPTTKLVLEVAGSADTIGKTISIGYDIVIAGTKYSGSKNVTLAATATEVELNLNSITGGAKLNAYDGSTASYSQTMLFGNNNEFDSSGNSTNNNGNNYIKLNFVGQDGGSFMVNFRGLYDKV